MAVVHNSIETLLYTRSDFEVSTGEVFKALQSLKTKKSPGSDKIYPKLLIDISREIHSFNNAVQYVFATWYRCQWLKIAERYTHFIKRRPKSFNIYRPISLTSIFGKLFETIIIRHKVVHYLKCNSLILDSQHGFTNTRSSLSNILTYYNELFGVYNFSKSLDIVYLDFQKRSIKFLT